jgi:hypothetical protein
VVERRRQGEQAQRQELGQEVQVRDAQEHGGQDRRLPQHHREQPGIVEIEEEFAARDLHEECRTIDEQPPALPAVPEHEGPKEADGGLVCD